MWHVKGNKQELVPNLELIQWHRRSVVITFDADSYTNKNVRRNIKELSAELEHRGAIVTVAYWDLQLGKGIDDVLVNHGKEMISAIMNHKQPYADWLRNLENQFNTANKQSKAKSDKLPPQDEVAYSLAEKYRSQLAWHSGIKSWFRYEIKAPGLWGEMTDESVKQPDCSLSTHSPQRSQLQC
jgi:DNA primase